MTSYGITDTGFVKKTASVIQDELIEAYKALPGFEDIKTEAGSVMGQIIGVQSEREALLWELAEDLFLVAFRDSADGQNLDRVAGLIGQARLQARHSTVTLTLKTTETSPVLVPAGSLASQSATGVQWETLEDGTIPAATGTVLSSLNINNINWQSGYTVRYTFSGSPSLASVVVGDQLVVTSATNSSNNGSFFITAVNDGSDYVEVTNTARTSASGDEAGSPGSADINNVATLTVSAQSVNTGLYEASAGTINTIDTPISGWLAVTNASAAVEGREQETDTEFRRRMAASTVIAQGGTVAAIASRLTTEVTGVTYASYRENRTATTDGNGLPPHSFEMVVVGGTDEDVAAMILLTKPAGIQTHGTTTEPTVDTVSGDTVNIKFSRVAEVDIYLIVNLTVNANYPTDGDTQVKQALLDYFDTLEHGDDVLNYRLIAAISEIDGITTVEILQGTAPVPTLTTNITIASTEIADLQLANITVNS